jgi:hypothetical protein
LDDVRPPKNCGLTSTGWDFLVELKQLELKKGPYQIFTQKINIFTHKN